jgi:hypothetical protein
MVLRLNKRPPMVKMTFLNADSLPPVPVTVEVPDHLVDDFRDVVYIASDPCEYMESYPYDWIDYDD